MNLNGSQDILKGIARLAQPWGQAFAALILLLAWILFLYRDTAIAMVTIWARSETFNHAFLVPPIVLWLVWRRRQLIKAQTPQPLPSMFILAACAGFAWLLGDLVAVNAVTQLAFVGLLVFAVLAVLGMSVARLIIFPLGFLFFAVPIGEFVMPQLMEWTANFTVFALRLSGIPVYREGLQFVIPSGNWSVVEACSGVRYLIASLTVGTLFAYLNYQSGKRRMLFVIVSILVPVIANWMRAYLIVMLGHFSGNKLAAGVDHLIYGWLFFGMVIMVMFIIGARWAEPEITKYASSDGLPESQNFSATKLWITSACFAALVTLPQTTLWALNLGEKEVIGPFNAPAFLGANWQADTPIASFKPSFRNPSAEINSSYASKGHTVGLYVGMYQNQNYERKLVSSSNVLVITNDSKWIQVASGNRSVTVGNQAVTFRTAELREAGLSVHANPARLVAWQVYWINGALTASDHLAKAYSAFYRLIGRGDGSAVIVVYVPKDDEAGGEQALLESFLSANYVAINELLLKAQQAGQ